MSTFWWLLLVAFGIYVAGTCYAYFVCHLAAKTNKNTKKEIPAIPSALKMP
jgi:hypothetical protein